MFTTLKIFLGGAWDLIRPYVVPVAVLLGIVVFGAVIFSRTRDDIVTRLQRQQATYDEEIKKINEAMEVERKQHEENLKKLHADLAAVQQRYSAQIKSLEEKKVVQINGLVKKFNDNPVEMARQLSQITGFKLVLPTEK
jgi:predicted nuclease with TOPRIM domain